MEPPNPTRSKTEHCWHLLYRRHLHNRGHRPRRPNWSQVRERQHTQQLVAGTLGNDRSRDRYVVRFFPLCILPIPKNLITPVPIPLSLSRAPWLRSYFYANQPVFLAIIIGCLPSFTILYRSSVNSHRGFLQTYFNANTHSIAHPHGKDMPLSNTSNASRATPHGGDGATWEGQNTVISSSQEELAKPGQISVTRSVVIEFEHEHEQGH